MFFCLKFLIFVFCIIFTTVFSSDDSHKDFLYKAKVVNPLCFSLLSEDKIVDLRDCTKQNEIVAGSTLEDRKGFIGSSYTYKDGEPPNVPYIYYKHISPIEKSPFSSSRRMFRWKWALLFSLSNKTRERLYGICKDYC